ncbi:MAG: MFS transporter [Candidatus Eisenbacteria bacterium]|nr:MFS transporter [Candidatus Eisenbacteria bacterium]
MKFFTAAFGVDGAVNLTLVGVPWKAIALGATPLELGLLPAVWSVVYIIAAIQMGRLSDRVARLRLSGAGAAIVVVAMMVLALARQISGLYLGLAILALGLAMFWPPLQAALAEADEPGRLQKNLGFFNLSWSSGKGIGFAAGGILYAAYGFGLVAAISAGIALAVAILLTSAPAPVRNPPISRTAPAIPVVPTAVAVTSAAFLAAAWLANGVAYGVNATLTYHFPKYLEAQGSRAAHFGIFLGLICLSQTVAFAVLARLTSWRFRRAPLYAMHLLNTLVLLILPQLRVPALQLLLAPFIGVSLGLAYYSSIFYSLNATARPGRNTGRHEAIIGSGVLIVPAAGGLLATATGELAAPYWFCAGLSVLAIGGEEYLLRRHRPAT